MKKVLILLLLFIFACGGTNEETVVEDTTTTVQDTATTTVQDTTTTTIPPAPTVDFNIVEIYNTKLVLELCSDAKELDITTEECLRQYRDNLELVFSYAENLVAYITELNTYLDAYPSAMTEEYTKLFQFVNNEYQAVPETYGIVANKYVERFGGVPIVNEIVFDAQSKISAGCKVNGKFSISENLHSASLKYKNDVGQIYTFNIRQNDTSFNLHLLTQGGVFKFYQGTVTNFFGEEYSINSFNSEFFVNHLFNRAISVQFPENPINVGEEFQVVLNIDPLRPVEFAQIGLFEQATGWAQPYTGMHSSVVNGNQIIFNNVFTADPKDAESFFISNGPSNPSKLFFYPGQNEYEINFININSGGRESLDVISPWRTMGLNLPGECGPIDTLDMKDAFPFMKESLLKVNP